MANKHLNRKPHHIDENTWWYEESRGIQIYVEKLGNVDPVIVNISWSELRDALDRKNRQDLASEL